MLRALSSDAAAAIMADGRKFDLSEGSPADFVVLAANPLDDFKAIAQIRQVIKDGFELVH